MPMLGFLARRTRKITEVLKQHMMLNDAVSSDHGILQSFLATSFEGLAEAGGILSFTREPAGEPVVSLQVADLALVCHRVLQHAD